MQSALVLAEVIVGCITSGPPSRKNQAAKKRESRLRRDAAIGRMKNQDQVLLGFASQKLNANVSLLGVHCDFQT